MLVINEAVGFHYFLPACCYILLITDNFFSSETWRMMRGKLKIAIKTEVAMLGIIEILDKE